jgi:hypothetical protein
VAGIPVRLHYSFFLLLLLEFASSLLNYKYESNSYPLYILLIVTMYGPVLLVTILVSDGATRFGLSMRTLPPR